MKIPHERFSGYDTVLAQAWLLLWKKPLVFVAHAYITVVMSLFIFVFGLLAETLFAEVTTNSQIVWAAAFTLLGLVVFFFLLAHTVMVGVRTYGLAVLKKDFSFRDCFRSKGLFTRVVKILLALILVSTPLWMLLIAIFSAVVSAAEMNQSVAVFNWFLLGLFILGAIFYNAWFVFLRPLLAYSKESTWGLINRLWLLLTDDPRTVWATTLFMLSIAFAASFIFTIINNSTSGIVGSLVTTTGNIIVLSWLSVFSFMVYVKRYGHKV